MRERQGTFWKSAIWAVDVSPTISGSQFEPIDWTEKRSEAAVAGTGPDCAAHDSRTIKILPAGQKNKLSM